MCAGHDYSKNQVRCQGQDYSDLKMVCDTPPSHDAFTHQIWNPTSKNIRDMLVHNNS